MSDTKESMPAQPPTRQLPAMTDRALLEDLARAVKEGFTDTNSRLSGIETTVDTLVDDGKSANQRMTRIEVRMDTFEERQNTSSMRAKEPSQHDVEIRAELDEERKAREALATKVESIESKTDVQTAMLTRIEAHATSILSSPKVKAIGWGLWLLLAGWLASKGIKVGP